MSMSRRQLLGAAVVVAAAGAAAVASKPQLFNIGSSRSKLLKIGYITALSGVRANFGEADLWNLTRIRASLKDGLAINGTNYQVEIVLKDNQSDQGQSAAVSNELLLRDKVDLLLIQDGDAVFPAGPLCDANGIPSISTMMPWQAFIYGRGSTPARGFPYSFHFFWGNDDVIRNFVGMWDTVPTNKKVGTFYADNSPGRSYADPDLGMPRGLKSGGYTELSAGLFKMTADDFSSQVSLFKSGAAQIVSGFAFRRHFIAFWKQAQQSGYRPEICTVAAAFLFPSAVEALGPSGDGMSTEAWWTPNFPFQSSLTGQTARALADEWERKAGRQWTQPLGYAHALWEVAIAALKASADPKDKRAVRDSIANLTHDTVVGPVRFKDSMVKNVASTAVVGGQWRKATDGRHPFELLITHNGTAPHIPVDGEFVPLSRVA